MDSPLDNRSLVFDPIAGAFLVSVDGAQGEAAYVLLNHLPLVFIGGVGLCGLFGKTVRIPRGKQRFCQTVSAWFGFFLLLYAAKTSGPQIFTILK